MLPTAARVILATIWKLRSKVQVEVGLKRRGDGFSAEKMPSPGDDTTPTRMSVHAKTL